MYRVYFKFNEATGWHVSACWRTTSPQVVYRGARGSLAVLSPLPLPVGRRASPIRLWRYQKFYRYRKLIARKFMQDTGGGNLSDIRTSPALTFVYSLPWRSGTLWECHLNELRVV